MGAIFSTKQKQKINQNTSGTQYSTTTPIAPLNASNFTNNYLDIVSKLGLKSPGDYVAGPSQLQNQAWQQAGNLGGWQQGMNSANAFARQAGSAPAGPRSRSTPRAG